MNDVLYFIKNIINFSIVQKSKLLKAFDELKEREWHPNYKLKHFSGKELRKIIIRMYHEEELSIRKIAQKLGVCYNAVYHYLIKFNISRRSYSEARKFVPSPKFTEETKRKMSGTMKKRWQNSEYREKMLKNLKRARKVYANI